MTVDDLSRPRLVDRDEAPEWTLRPFILRGYRPQCSFVSAVASLSFLHNESANVWSHGIGVIAFILIGVVHLSHPIDSWDNFLMTSFMLATGGICMIFSTFYHLFAPVSKETFDKFYRCDLMGISSMVAGGWLPGVYYGFSCFPTLKNAWLCVAMVVITVALAWPHINYPWKERFNPFVYASMAILGFCPLFHWFLMMGGWGNEEVRAFLLPLLSVAVMGGVGFVFFVSQWPERSFPGKFDYCCGSHMWWHFCIVGGGLQAYNSLIQIQTWRMNHPCPQ